MYRLGPERVRHAEALSHLRVRIRQWWKQATRNILNQKSKQNDFNKESH